MVGTSLLFVLHGLGKRRSVTWELLLPVVLTVAVFSALPHKEYRFLMFVLPSGKRATWGELR